MPSIRNILVDNHLIGGRLHLAPVAIQKLYRSAFKQHNKIKEKISNEENIVQSSLDQIKNLKSELKYCKETLQKAFHPSTDNISLLYKKIGNHYYIKARFYWQGHQREVQVGSISSVLHIIKRMLDQGYFKNIAVPKSFHITWDQFKNRSNLIDATKKIASLKFQEYIIRKLHTEDTHQFRKGDIEKIDNEKQAKKSQGEKNKGEFQEKENYEWYVQWRRNNL